VSRLNRHLERARSHEAQLAGIAAYPCALAWSSRGDMLAVGGDHGGVELIDPATCIVRRRISAHDGPVQSIAWHPQRDALLTTGQDGAVRLWDSPFETVHQLIAPSTSWADHACWSTSGDRAAVALGARAHVLATDGAMAVTEPVASTIAGLAFTPSGKSLGVACYGGVQLFEPTTGRPTRKLEWKGSMLSIAFAPDGSTVACGCQFFQPVVDFLSGVVEAIHNTLDRVVAFVGRLVAKIPSRFRPAFLDSIVDAGEAAQTRMAERTAKAVAPTTATFVREVTTAGPAFPSRGTLAGVPLGAAAAGAALPAAAELRVRGQISDAEIDAIVARGVALSDGRPVQAHVTVNVDGETLARATARASRSVAARSFAPSPVGGWR
jgi:WD domain, G-beta repeat